MPKDSCLDTKHVAATIDANNTECP